MYLIGLAALREVSGVDSHLLPSSGDWMELRWQMFHYFLSLRSVATVGIVPGVGRVLQPELVERSDRSHPSYDAFVTESWQKDNRVFPYVLRNNIEMFS
jgi:hypothetical protein